MSYTASLRIFLLTLSLSNELLALDVKPSRDTAWPPEQTRDSIELDGPYEVQLVAAEPLVRDPVEMCWDAKGRCFVVDMIDYPMGGPEGTFLTRIQQLIDRDGDGDYDESLTFADELDHAQGLLPHREGLIVTTRTQILFLKDSDGDGVADKRTPLVEGFNPSFSQLQVSSPRWGLDGEVYFNNGLDTREIYPVDKQASQPSKINIARHNLRWNPRTGELNPTSGFGQYGAGFDDWGRHFSTSNRTPIMFSVVPHEAVTRHSSTALSQGWEAIAPHGPDSRVYPLEITHTTSDAHSGTNTSACGLTVYRGDLMPELRGEIFVCDPTGQLITRFQRPQKKGASLTSARVGQQTEFFRSSDEWCRPVNLTTGPDGALYVCDIYRRYIDHARFFPDEFVGSNDMRAGENQGRIWRIVPKANPIKLHPFESAPTEISELVRWLGHSNAWQRETAQRRLLELAEDEDLASEILGALRDYSSEQEVSPLATIHTLWTWAGVWAQLPESKQSAVLKNDGVPRIPESSPPEVVENIVMLNARYPRLIEGLEIELEEIAFHNGTPRSRMLYLAATVAEESAIDGEFSFLLTILNELEDPWFQGAVLSRYPHHAGRLAYRLLNSDFPESATPSKIAFIRNLAAASSASQSLTDFQHLLDSLQIQPNELLWWKPALMQGLSEGLARSGNVFEGVTLQAFIAGPRSELSEARDELRHLFERIDSTVADATTPLEERLAALPLLTQRPYDSVAPLLKRLLASDQPPALSQSAFDTLRRFGADTAAPLLYELLPTSNPSLRQQIVGLLTSNERTALDLFQRMDRGEVPHTLVDVETRWRYLQSIDPTLRQLAEKLFQRPSADRAGIIAEYFPSTQIEGNPQRGREIFRTNCMLCHTYQSEGTAVGPDISDVRAKEKAALLSDILDPNRMIEARWSAYHIATKDGRTLVGLIEGETAEEVTLTFPGGVRETVSRTQIASQRSLDTSLMPVGLEAGIDIEQMADLLSFLRGELSSHPNDP